MFSDIAYILLDTNVVYGWYALSQKRQNTEKNKREWERKISSLLEKLPEKQQRLTIPTPVCYELMCKDRYWNEFIGKSEEDMFRFAKSGIANNILKRAADYSLNVSAINHDGGQEKIKTMDPLIAAYSLEFRYYLLTANQVDFPEPYFNLVAAESLVLLNKESKPYRSMMYLLKPEGL